MYIYYIYILTYLIGLSASEATLATKLQQQASQRNRSDISFKNARLRELDLKRKVSKTKENIIALEQEYECIHKEYTELTDTTTDILERTMTQSNKVNDSLERKLRSIENNIRGGIMTSSFDAHTSQSISNGTSIDTTLSSSLLYCHVSESYSAEDRLDVLTKIIEEDCYPSNINLINQSSHHVKSNIVTSSMKLSTIEEQPRSLIVKNRDDNEDNNDDDSDHLRFSDSTDSLSSHIHEPATLV